MARDELEAERQRDRLDVPAPQGREVPQRQDDDGGRRRRELQAVPVADDVADPRLDSPEPPRTGGRGQDRAVHGAVPAEVAEQRLPVARQPDDVPGDHPAGGDRGEARHVGCERHDRNRSVPRQELYAEQTSRARPLPALLGRSSRRSTGQCSRSTRARPPWSSRYEPASSTCASSCPRRRAEPSGTTAGTRSTRRRRRTTRCSVSGRTATRSGTRECGGRSHSR